MATAANTLLEPQATGAVSPCHGCQCEILFQLAHAQQVLTLPREGMGRKNRLEFLFPECSVTKQRDEPTGIYGNLLSSL